MLMSDLDGANRRVVTNVTATAKPVLPQDSEARKNMPIASGVLDYFPAALAYVAKISKYGNDKHNPGQSLHWSRGKSTDHADCCARHLIERGTKDENGLWHDGMLAWRALANLQELLEREEGAPQPRGATDLPKASESPVLLPGSPITKA